MSTVKQKIATVTKSVVALAAVGGAAFVAYKAVFDPEFRGGLSDFAQAGLTTAAAGGVVMGSVDFVKTLSTSGDISDALSQGARGVVGGIVIGAALGVTTYGARNLMDTYGSDIYFEGGMSV